MPCAQHVTQGAGYWGDNEASSSGPLHRSPLFSAKFARVAHACMSFIKTRFKIVYMSGSTKPNPPLGGLLGLPCLEVDPLLLLPVWDRQIDLGVQVPGGIALWAKESDGSLSGRARPPQGSRAPPSLCLLRARRLGAAPEAPSLGVRLCRRQLRSLPCPQRARWVERATCTCYLSVGGGVHVLDDCRNTQDID